MLTKILCMTGQNESILGGISCGILFFIATSLQQIGILYTSVGKAGFITALYIVIVPILGIFFETKSKFKNLD